MSLVEEHCMFIIDRVHPLTRIDIKQLLEKGHPPFAFYVVDVLTKMVNKSYVGMFSQYP